MFLALLLANWVCRNDLNLNGHVEAIVTSPSFSPLHISALQSALFFLAFYSADAQFVAPALIPFGVGLSHNHLMFLEGTEDVGGRGDRALEDVFYFHSPPPI